CNFSNLEVDAYVFLCRFTSGARRDDKLCVRHQPSPLQAQSAGLLLVLDGQPQRVEWQSVHPHFKHSPVWVSFHLRTLFL
ncbi:hypothetical protein GOODEAATRI_018412, partial [Goodea atripinnis]